MSKPDPEVTLLIDAPCELCRTSMRFLRDRDRKGLIQFVPLDSPEGRELLFEAKLEPSDADSVVLLVDGRPARYSSALVGSLRLLGGWWKVAGDVLYLVPLPLRDLVYRAVSKHRHLWPFNRDREAPFQREYTPVVSTADRSIRSVTPAPEARTRTVSGEESRESSPAIESTTTTGRDASE